MIDDPGPKVPQYLMYDPKTDLIITKVALSISMFYVPFVWIH